MVKELKTQSQLLNMILAELKKHEKYHGLQPQIFIYSEDKKIEFNWGISKWNDEKNQPTKTPIELIPLITTMQRRYKAIVSQSANTIKQ